MWHNCPETNTRWNCLCGSRCGYPKNGNCLFHRNLQEYGILDISQLANVIGSLDEVCEKGKLTIGNIVEDVLLKIRDAGFKTPQQIEVSVMDK